jgi:tRNA G10  N-methylase Trm11
MRKNNEEEQHQVAFVTWFRAQYPKYSNLLTLGSFGENIGQRRMKRLKEMGLTPGYPDLFLAICKKIEHHTFKRTGKNFALEEWIDTTFYGGLYIEMKTKKGRLSDVQKEIHKQLRDNHYVVEVCRDWEEAKDAVKNYIAGC